MRRLRKPKPWRRWRTEDLDRDALYDGRRGAIQAAALQIDLDLQPRSAAKSRPMNHWLISRQPRHRQGEQGIAQVKCYAFTVA
jgi:hypothetical protein